MVLTDRGESRPPERVAERYAYLEDAQLEKHHYAEIRPGRPAAMGENSAPAQRTPARPPDINTNL